MYICILEEALLRQFTMNIEDGLLLAAKRHALQTGRTVSDIVRDVLAREVGWVGGQDERALDSASALPVLRAYSNGRTSRREAMEALGLPPERRADFVEAMNRLDVEWPTPDPEQIDQEAELVVEAIRGAAHAN